MTPSRSCRSSHVVIAIALAVALSAASVRALGAQQPAPPPPPAQPPPPPPSPVSPTTSQAPPQAAPIVAYRAPVIALVQPPSGGTVPQDRPVVVFRFAQGEPTDPVDARSFAVSVDGEDRTALFQVAAGEAWGLLAAAGGEQPIALGARQVTARICSARGACAAASATVTVVPDQAATASGTRPRTAAPSRRERLIDLVLQAARRLLVP